MAKTVKLQVCVFGDFSKLVATHDAFASLLPEFSDFLPITIPVFNIDVKAREVIQTPRINIVNPQDGWSVFAQEERIDASLDINLDEGREINYSVETQNGFEFLKKFISILIPDIKFTRLAINTRLVEVNGNQKPTIPFLSGYPEYVGATESLKEWSLSFNKDDIICLKNEEKLNEIVTLSLGRNSVIPDEYATLIVIDINTLQENSNARFDLEDLEAFKDKAVTQIGIIIADLKKGM